VQVFKVRMKRKQRSKQFWIVLGIVNLLAISYPIWSSVYGESNDAWLTYMMLVGIVFVLVIGDLIAIVMKYALE
jgi:heme/copper-type cytochrome/quinol oxidase subunit 2